MIESPEADAVLSAIQTVALADHDSENARSARFFLLEGEAFFETGKIAGLDARKLRRHLRRTLCKLDRDVNLLEF